MNPGTQQELAAALIDAQGHLKPAGTDTDLLLAERLDIHRNHIAASRVEALRQVFPVLNRLLGTDYFGALAQAFSRAHPPRSPVLHEYGADLPAFVAQFPPLAAWPYLADITRIEWARLCAFHAADGIDLELASQPNLLLSELRLQPSVHWVCSDFPIARIWRSQFEPGSALTVDPATWSAESVLVWREGWALRTEPVNAAELALLRYVSRPQHGTDEFEHAVCERLDLTDSLAKLLRWQVFQVFES